MQQRKIVHKLLADVVGVNGRNRLCYLSIAAPRRLHPVDAHRLLSIVLVAETPDRRPELARRRYLARFRGLRLVLHMGMRHEEDIAFKVAVPVDTQAKHIPAEHDRIDEEVLRALYIFNNVGFAGSPEALSYRVDVVRMSQLSQFIVATQDRK